ncbi:MAG: energy-coupling factor transporter ATPase [Lachnospiraceae bacterium]|nr:energy-coupling factor transporter ATPase [Lachnospiraceae bacterium]
MQLEVKDVSYTYTPEAENPHFAVDHVSFSVEKGEFIALIGHTGSGKSTLIQFLDGLLKPTSGEVLFHGENVAAKGYDLKRLRQRIGLVFQYPEYQLFETTVLKDVCYGPKNQGLSENEQIERAKEALRLVNFPEASFEKSPFDLSGGQKRRAAIAGILAMKPEVLILDEPTAGLDPKGREDILTVCRTLNEEGITIILVSHSMEDVAEYAGRILVMNHGALLYDDTPEKVFANFKELEKIGLSAPEVTYVMEGLRARGWDVRTDVFSVEAAKKEILKAFRKD